MEAFIDAFKKSAYYKQLINRYGDKTIVAYIGGSRVHNLETPYSDYDITIIVDEDIAYEISMPHCFLQYKDTLVHWYYLPAKALFSSTLTHDLYDLMMPTTLLSLVKNPLCILYFNNKYSKVFETIVTGFGKLSNDWYAFIFNTYKKSIQRYLLDQPVKPGDLRLSAKKLYFLCICSCSLRGEIPNKDFLVELKLAKRTRYLSDSCRAYIKETLKKFEVHAQQCKNDLNLAIKRVEDKIANELRNVY